ncbi:hypothetical protein HDV06_000006 [Boothiomyces sp. JEL0866]|nr:hypothetical protein HDV06_000006 [Boothiomyces sp. JEL0866]
MASGLVFQSGWFNSYECVGPPSIMSIFYESNAPVVYSNLLQDTPLPFCGSAFVPVPIGCCLSSLDLSFTSNYQSLTRNYIDHTSSFTAPASANSYAYCNVKANSNNSLSGLYQVYFLADNQCMDNVICDINSNVITIYNSTGCTGYHESFSLVSDQPQSSLIYGEIELSLYLVRNGPVTFSWLAYTPQYKLIPQYHAPIEQFAVFCYAMSLLIGSTTCGYYTRRYYLHRLFRDLIFSITQFLITINIILECIYYTTIMSNIGLSEIDFGVQLSGVYSLFSVYVSLHILFTIYVEYQKTIIQKLIYIFFTVFHFGTMYYFAISDMYVIICGVQDETSFYIANIQENSFVYWKGTFIIMEIVPSIVILTKLIFGASARRLQQLHTKINIIVGLSIFQITIICSYELFNLIRAYTLWFGNDRVNLAANSINYFMQTMSSLIVLIVYERLVEVLEKLSNRRVCIPRKRPSGSVTEVIK